MQKIQSAPQKYLFTQSDVFDILQQGNIVERGFREEMYYREDDLTVLGAWYEKHHDLDVETMNEFRAYQLLTKAEILERALNKFGIKNHRRAIEMFLRQNAIYNRQKIKGIRSAASRLLKHLGAEDRNLPIEETRAAMSGQIRLERGAEAKERYSRLSDLTKMLRELTDIDPSPWPVGILRNREEIPDGDRRVPTSSRSQVKDHIARFETRAICELWERLFQMDIRTSVDPISGEPTGPMIRFMGAILKKWYPSKRFSNHVLRERIRLAQNPMGRLVQKKR